MMDQQIPSKKVLTKGAVISEARRIRRLYLKRYRRGRKIDLETCILAASRNLITKKGGRFIVNPGINGKLSAVDFLYQDGSLGWNADPNKLNRWMHSRSYKQTMWEGNWAAMRTVVNKAPQLAVSKGRITFRELQRMVRLPGQKTLPKRDLMDLLPLILSRNLEIYPSDTKPEGLVHTKHPTPEMTALRREILKRGRPIWTAGPPEKPSS